MFTRVCGSDLADSCKHNFKLSSILFGLFFIKHVFIEEELVLNWTLSELVVLSLLAKLSF